jgi:hypothetical protein
MIWRELTSNNPRDAYRATRDLRKSAKWAKEKAQKRALAKKQAQEKAQAATTSDKTTNVEKEASAASKRFDKAYLLGPVFACNDIYLEMRAGGIDQWRGFLTLLTIACWYPILASASLVQIDINRFIHDGWGVVDFAYVFAFLWSSAITFAFAYFYFRYIYKYSRLELFTSRYLLIRFNRVTRQVYLHRPPSCGGIVVLPWEGISHEPGMPFSLGVTWEAQKGDPGFPPQVAYVGYSSLDEDDHEAQWEYIRRYMDEGGLSAVEKPKLSLKGPWPHEMLRSKWDMFKVFVSDTPLINVLTALGFLLVSPFILIVLALHWLSLLLCWTPRWPKIIREAGQPGKPTPKLTTIDDYPPEVAAQLKKNAFHWMPKPAEVQNPAEAK